MRVREKQVVRCANPALRCVVLLVCSASIVSPAAGAQAASPDEQAAKSGVVRIEAVTASRATKVGTGFCWKDGIHVVTALHVVAGSKIISVISEGNGNKQTPAVIEGVSLVADLALLRLKSDIGLKPLHTVKTAPGRGQEFTIWGYPRAVPEIQGDPIRFSRTFEPTSTMGSIFKSEAAFRKVVGDQNFPGYQVQILRVGSIIQPGHSGAPICDSGGQVVGIADGGLNQGVASINWAIPAAKYLSSDIFKDPPPTQEASSGSDLMSATEEGDQDVSVGSGAPQAGAKANGGSKANEVLHLAWSAPLSRILETVSDEDADEIDELSADIDRDHFEKAVIDVYEDYETGATIAVPHGMTLSFSAEKHALVASSPDEQLVMLVQIVNNDTPEDGAEAWSNFDELIQSLDTWQKDPKMKDLLQKDTNYKSLDMVRIARDTEDETVIRGQMTASLILDDDDFMGSAIFIADLPAVAKSKANTELARLLQACVVLSDFAKE